jgi:hypothetical protein
MAGRFVRNWIKPSKARKACEVGICRCQFSLKLNGERRELSVGRQVSGRPEVFQQVEEYLSVSRPGRDDMQPGAC